MIISASRRTDIPAFYGEWFMNRLREGYCLVANPFNPAMVSRVSLALADVDVIVFWSKNPKAFFSHLTEIDRMGFHYYFLYTLNHYPESLEPNMPPLEERLSAFRELAENLGAARVVWRYDPIILSHEPDYSYHLRAFEKIVDELSGATERVIISFVDFYRKTERRIRQVEAKTGDTFYRDPFACPEFGTLVHGLAVIAAQNGLQIQTCAEDLRIETFGIRAGKCIDDELIRRVFGISVSAPKDPGQRGKCGCILSRDIGATDSCLNGCEYCYSTVSHMAAQARAKRHDPRDPCLIPLPD